MRRTLYRAERIGDEYVFATDPRHSKHEEAKGEHVGELLVREAADRVHRHLEEAKEGGYWTNAWYSYLRREDVELMAETLRAR